MLNKWFINSSFVYRLKTVCAEVRTCERYITLKHVLWPVSTQAYKHIEKYEKKEKDKKKCKINKEKSVSQK